MCWNVLLIITDIRKPSQENPSINQLSDFYCHRNIQKEIALLCTTPSAYSQQHLPVAVAGVVLVQEISILVTLAGFLLIVAKQKSVQQYFLLQHLYDIGPLVHVPPLSIAAGRGCYIYTNCYHPTNRPHSDSCRYSAIYWWQFVIRVDHGLQKTNALNQD